MSELVRPCCFHTLRVQAQSYAKVPWRVLLTYEYTPSSQEQALYDLLYAYVNQPVKRAFPEMDQYDLALRLLGLQGSSTAAILQTIRGVIKRLERTPGAQAEFAQWKQMELAAGEVERDAKAAELLDTLKLGFAMIQKRGAAKKAVIFTESIETQNEALWRLVKSFFLRYNETNSDCVFVIDEAAKTVTATEYQELPVLCGITERGRALDEDECKALLALPVRDFTEDGSRSPHWLKRGGAPHPLDKLVPVEPLIVQASASLSPAQAEELERMKLRANGQKAALARKLDGMEVQVKAFTEKKN